MVNIALLVTPRSFWVLLLLVFLLPSFSSAFSSNVELETIVRGFERDLPSAENTNVLPAYGYLKFEAKDFTDLGLSFHGYGWGRYEMADSRYYDSRSEGELIYGYLEYKKKFSSLRARLGRFHVFEGVANESLDGLWASGNITPQISLSAYAGQPVGLSSAHGRGGDSMVGGRFAYRGADKFAVGVSAKFSNNDGDSADRMLGLDLNWYLPKNIDLYGFSKFNTEISNFAEHSWEFHIPVNDYSFKPYLQYYDYEGYFGTGDKAAFPFQNLAQSGESVTIFGLDSFWRQSETLHLGCKLKFYSYGQNDSSEYLSAILDFIGEERTNSGVEVGYMRGESASNNYLLLRIYTYRDQLSEKLLIDFISADLLYALYDQEIFGEESSLFVSLGMGKQFFKDALDVKLSGDYSADPYYASDVKGMLSATYYFGRGH